jgi:hypothetical protein
VPARSRSDALPDHVGQRAMIARTCVATGSASRMPSRAARRFSLYARKNVPGGANALSHAVPQWAKSAIRGHRLMRLAAKAQSLRYDIDQRAQDPAVLTT